jgi:hypothetical protein
MRQRLRHPRNRVRPGAQAPLYGEGGVIFGDGIEIDMR